MVILVTRDKDLLDSFEIPTSFAGKLIEVKCILLSNDEECYEDLDSGILFPTEACNYPRPTEDYPGGPSIIPNTKPS